MLTLDRSYVASAWRPAQSPQQPLHAELLTQPSLENDMGKYFIAWILGVPAVLLVGIYVVSHVL